MRIAAPIWILLWVVAMQPVAAQRGQVGHALEFQQLGELLPDGTKVAVIQRGRGVKTKFEVVRLEKGRFTLPTPPNAAESPARAWFAIVGMTRVEQFEAFLDHPERWAWVQIRSSFASGIRFKTRFHPKGATPQLRGRILDSEGKPLECLSVRFWRQPPKGQPGTEISTWMRWGYDPYTGRFWALETLPESRASSEYLLDLEPGASDNLRHPGWAPLLRYSWVKGKDVTVRIRPACHVKGSVLGLSDAVHLRYQVALIREGRSVFRREAGAHRDFAFDGLPAGTYTLDVRLRRSPEPLFVSGALKVESGQELVLPPIDLSDKVRKIQVSVTTAAGDPIDAMIWNVTSSVVGASLLVGTGGGNTGATGKRSFVIPKMGIPLCVSAKGWGPQVFAKVTQDLQVSLQRPRLLHLRLVGLDKHPELLGDLYLRAQPTRGYPRWAWQALSYVGAHDRRQRAAQDGPRALPAVATLDPKGSRVMEIPTSGTWKFELAYFRRTLSFRIPLPNLDSVDIQEPKQDLTVEVPISILQRAHTKFQVLLRDG